MVSKEGAIRPIRISDIPTITRMAFDNMSGNDRQFTKLTANPLSRMASYLTLPIYFLWAGKGFKFILDGRVAGCAYLHLRPLSGYIFNVNVNRPHRRKGVAQELMGKLERETWLNGRRWTCLQVDNDNLAARNLYEKLGYRPYNSSFLRLEGSPLDWEAEPGAAQLERLRPHIGRKLFNRYLAHEKTNGEPVDVSITNDYESGKLSGNAYWRCLLDGQEVGVIISGGIELGVVLQLAFDQSTWGQSTLAGIVKLLTSKMAVQPQRVDLVFGSSGHFLQAKETMGDFGFIEQLQARMLMFKSLSQDALTNPGA